MEWSASVTDKNFDDALWLSTKTHPLRSESYKYSAYCDYCPTIRTVSTYTHYCSALQLCELVASEGLSIQAVDHLKSSSCPLEELVHAL